MFFLHLFQEGVRPIADGKSANLDGEAKANTVFEGEIGTVITYCKCKILFSVIFLKLAS